MLSSGLYACTWECALNTHTHASIPHTGAHTDWLYPRSANATFKTLRRKTYILDRDRDSESSRKRRQRKRDEWEEEEGGLRRGSEGTWRTEGVRRGDREWEALPALLVGRDQCLLVSRPFSLHCLSLCR